MTFSDITEICRLCLMPLNTFYIDCALDKEFNDTIKMVYNIDINAVDVFSTKVCLMCCEVLMYNTIHHHRAVIQSSFIVEAQNSLTRVQQLSERIKNKLRKFGKKKSEKKCEKHTLPDSPIIDVEMIEVEPISTSHSLFNLLPSEFLISIAFHNLVMPQMDYEMDMEVINGNGDSEMIDNSSNTEKDTPSYLTDFNDWNNYADDVIGQDNVKPSQSLFQLAKNFCCIIMKKQKTNIDIEEITHKMALLRFNV
ncbi:uncharacterized protein LOC116351083 isoform X1 [Contarinia nasturtii]|uniref:uncharacterized protein LOC116351083 isoform X1 n=1 Tax=Contarinia nasturtii TaxID=265458 RepID=UPI0012D3F040|nr:uncharacterized protein LOC116351083 isoform X1 [Contarinia nasturtii]